MAEAIQGKRILDFVRKKSAQATHTAYPLPLVTGADFDLQRDTDTKTTKDGDVATIGNLTVEPKVTLNDSDSAIIKVMEDSIFNREELEYWHVFLDKKDNENKYYAYYMIVEVTEDSQSSDADDVATREFTLTPKSEVARGYTELPGGMEELVEFVFKGLKPVTEGDTTGGGKAAQTTEMPKLGSEK